MKLTHNLDLGLLILRIGSSLLLLFHGFAKLLGGKLIAVESMLANFGLPQVLAYGVLIGEFVAPILIILGWRTRFAALTVVFTFIAALILGHSDHLLALSEYGGWAAELPMLYLIPALALLFTGSGRYALSHTKTWD